MLWTISGVFFSFNKIEEVRGEQYLLESKEMDFSINGPVNINSSGEIVTLQMNEELSPGIKLIALQPEKAVFEKGIDSYLHINFKNQIKETSDPF